MDENSPLIEAAAGGSLSEVSKILDSYENDGAVNHALLQACANGHVDVVSLLISHGTNQPKMKKQKFLEKFAIFSADSRISFYGASHNFSFFFFRVNSPLGANVNGLEINQKQTPLIAAAGNLHAVVLQVLLDYGATAGGDMALYAALTNPAVTPEVARILSQFAPALMNPVAEYKTAVDCACMLGNVEIVDLMIGAGGYCGPHMDDYKAPLTLAIEAGHLELAKYFISKFPKDPNALSYYDPFRDNIVGRSATLTPIAAAARVGNLELVQLLVEAGVPVNPEGVEYAMSPTALMAAAEAGKMKIVKYLVEQGADVKAKPRNKEDAISLATKNGHKEIANFLKNK